MLGTGLLDQSRDFDSRADLELAEDVPQVAGQGGEEMKEALEECGAELPPGGPGGGGGSEGNSSSRFG